MPPGPLSKLLSSLSLSAIPPAILTTQPQPQPSLASQLVQATQNLRPAPQHDPDLQVGRKELVLAVFRAGAIGFITFYIVRWILRFADPTYQQKQKAKIKAKEIMERLGVKGICLNEHEVMIASHLVDPNHLKISWADIAGLDNVIEQIKKTVIYPVLAQQRIVRVSRLIQPPKGEVFKLY